LSVRNDAVAAECFAKAAKLGSESLAYATEIKLLAEQKAGGKLTELEKGKTGPSAITSTGDEVISPFREALEKAQISDDQAARWQRLAKLSPEETAVAIESAKERVLRASDRGSAITYVNQPSIDAAHGHIPLAGTKHLYTVTKLLWPEEVESCLAQLLISKSLHACCGKSLLGDVRMDADKAHDPDIIADAAYMPLDDNSFASVLCDPPYDGKLNWNHNVLAELSRVASERIIFQHWFIPANPDGLYRKAQEKFALSAIYVWQPKTYFGRAQLISVFDRV
jgi:hypothetical protein